jgi:hypothetical protein
MPWLLHVCVPRTSSVAIGNHEAACALVGDPPLSNRATPSMPRCAAVSQPYWWLGVVGLEVHQNYSGRPIRKVRRADLRGSRVFAHHASRASGQTGG